MKMVRKNLPIVAVDIDNTVADHVGRLKELYDPLKQTISYEASNTEDVVRNDKVISGSIESINRIAKDYQIYWLTARKKHLYSVTLEWLKINNFKIDKLIFVKLFNDKIDELIKIGPTLFIDDLKYDYYSMKPKNATIMMSKLDENNIPYFQINNNWPEVIDTLYGD